MAIGLFYVITIGLEIAPVHHNGSEAAIRKGLNDSCIAVAFVSQVYSHVAVYPVYKTGMAIIRGGLLFQEIVVGSTRSLVSLFHWSSFKL